MDNLKISDDIVEAVSERLIFGSFVVGRLEVAVDVALVQEVVNYPETFTKMPLSSSCLEGIFSLRGAIIPILNLKSLLGLGNSEIIGSEKIAIVDCDGAKIGLVFDSTSEILRINQSDILSSNPSKGQEGYMSGCIKLDQDSRILNILDIKSLVSIANLNDILTKQKISSGILTHKEFQRNLKKCIVFTVGSLKLSFEINGINEVIKVSELKGSHIQCELCLGMVELRGLVIPIIDVNNLLEGEGYSESSIENQRIIILKNEGVSLGLLVDSVQNIQPFSDGDLLPIPILREKHKEIFVGCISSESSEDVILINHETILAHNEIVEISKGHDLIYNKDYKDVNSVRKKVINQSFISFRINDLYGLEISEIKEIINYSEDIIPSPGSSPLIKGMLNLRGDVITIVDAREMFSIDRIDLDFQKSKILIFEAKSKLVGLVVDSLESIITIDINSKLVLPSIVTRDLEKRLGDDLKEVISFKKNDDLDTVLTILNLENIALRF